MLFFLGWHSNSSLSSIDTRWMPSKLWLFIDVLLLVMVMSTVKVLIVWLIAWLWALSPWITLHKFVLFLPQSTNVRDLCRLGVEHLQLDGVLQPRNLLDDLQSQSLHLIEHVVLIIPFSREHEWPCHGPLNVFQRSDVAHDARGKPNQFLVQLPYGLEIISIMLILDLSLSKASQLLLQFHLLLDSRMQEPQNLHDLLLGIVHLDASRQDLD